MYNIRPSSEIRNKYGEISALCKSTGEPIFLTMNGTGDLVVMDIKAFTDRENRIAELQKQVESFTEKSTDSKRK
jgi:hypothetical protein